MDPAGGRKPADPDIPRKGMVRDMAACGGKMVRAWKE